MAGLREKKRYLASAAIVLLVMLCGCTGPEPDQPPVGPEPEPPLGTAQECGSKRAECEGSTTTECVEWRDFCGWEFAEMSPEFCDLLVNRQACVDQCLQGGCPEALCETLVFDAQVCGSCSAGCCSECWDLETCAEERGCRIAWIHPSGESWQFGGCENMDFCQDEFAQCDYLSLSYQGYRYASLIETDAGKVAEYGRKADELQNKYNAECNSGCPACGG